MREEDNQHISQELHTNNHKYFPVTKKDHEREIVKHNYCEDSEVYMDTHTHGSRYVPVVSARKSKTERFVGDRVDSVDTNTHTRRYIPAGAEKACFGLFAWMKKRSKHDDAVKEEAMHQEQEAEASQEIPDELELES
jgi:hypothetical protein